MESHGVVHWYEVVFMGRNTGQKYHISFFSTCSFSPDAVLVSYGCIPSCRLAAWLSSC